MSAKDALIVAQKQRIAELETRVGDMMPMHALGLFFSPTMSFENGSLTITFPYNCARQTLYLQKEDYPLGFTYAQGTSSKSIIFAPRRVRYWEDKCIQLDRKGFIILARFEQLDQFVTFPIAPTDFDRFNAILCRAAEAWTHAGK